MITIPEVVENIVRKSLFLEEALSLGIVNISALTRLIKRDVEKEVMNFTASRLRIKKKTA